MLKILNSFLFLLAINFSIAEKFSFDGYRLLRLNPKNESHIHHLKQWENNPEFDFWTRIMDINRNVDLVLSPNAFAKYIKEFNSINLPFKVVDHNIQKKADEQLRSMSKKRQTSIVGTYARYTEMMSFIDEMVAANPSIASSYIAGQTYEKRNLKVIVIKSATSQRKVWIDCGIHAREWVSPSTCIWVINKLITEYKSNVTSTVDLLKYFEFHVMPVMNADGYEYSHTTYRLWRKNRRPNSGSSCVGTDLNRNFGHYWMNGGSSTDPCSDVYAGPKANSELETLAVENAINAHIGKWDAYLTLHSYGQWWFTTWGYTTLRPTNYADLAAKAQTGVTALQAVYGTKGWIVGASGNLYGVASGGSEDWAAGVAGVQYSYCLELRPGQSGTDASYGFTLPVDRAPKVGEETYQGIKAFLNTIKK